MPFNAEYRKQVELLLSVLPHVASESCFALKGGTAINLFVRDMPRLSVDIDLVYLPMKQRNEALGDIREALDRIAASICQAMPDVQITKSYESKVDALRLVVARHGVQIKVELSPVLRGAVFEPELMAVSERVEDEFGFAEIKVVSLADLYAGKICAALDRQHPRDLFDVKCLFDNEGFTDDLRKALIVYLISHNRPISELLSPERKDIAHVYEHEFVNMADQDVPLEELLGARELLVKTVHGSLTENEKRFLLSFKGGVPDWELLHFESVKELPAVKWKLLNLQRMSAEKHAEAVKRLSDVLERQD